MGESADLNSAQQEAEAHLSQSKQTIQELQAALKAAQVTGLVCWQIEVSSHKPLCHPPPAPLPPGNWPLSAWPSIAVSRRRAMPLLHPTEVEPFHQTILCLFFWCLASNSRPVLRAVAKCLQSRRNHRASQPAQQTCNDVFVLSKAIEHVNLRRHHIQL